MNYKLYGLVLASEIPLLGVEPTTEPADACFRIGDTPEHLHSRIAGTKWWEATSNEILVLIRRIGRYLVSDGREIVVTPLEDATPADLGYMLLHAVVGALLQQRGALLLHASAVQLRDRTIVVAGHAGAGKSTSLLECTRRGGRIVTDDLAAITIDESRGVRIHGGLSHVNVWAQTLDRFGIERRSLRPVREHLHKFHVPAPSSDPGSAQVSAIACIRPGRREVAVRRLHGTDAFRVLREHIRVRHLAEAVDTVGTFRSVAHVAGHVPVFTITRPEADWRSVAAVADHICALADV